MQTTEVANSTKWVIDPLHSEIGFRVKHLMFTNVKGKFNEYDASVYITNNDLTTAEIDLSINAASINTHNEQRDTHLRSADFFDIEKFKEINFTGNTLEKVSEYSYALYGNLTMKSIKKQIKLDVELGGFIKDPLGTEKALLNIHGKINRKDWGLNWNTVLETGGVLVSEDVWITCEVQLIKQS